MFFLFFPGCRIPEGSSANYHMLKLSLIFLFLLYRSAGGTDLEGENVGRGYSHRGVSHHVAVLLQVLLVLQVVTHTRDNYTTHYVSTFHYISVELCALV